MKAGLLMVGFFAVIGLGFVCSVSKNPFVRLAGGLVFGLLSLGASALTVFLIRVGVRNHWSSDGPGMLLIMIAILVFGFAALGGWMFTASLVFDRRQPP